MAPKQNKSLSRHCPYNISEIKNAGACLRLEADKGSIGFLRRRFTFAAAGSCGNVWEGEFGLMEHIKGSFPMPERINISEDKNSDEMDPDIKDAGHSSNSALTDLNSDTSNSNRADPDKVEHSDGLEKPSSSLLFTSVSATTLGSKQNVKVSANASHKIFESDDDDDCIILEEEKVVINVNENTGGSRLEGVQDSKVPVTASSELAGASDEVMHWRRLFKVHDEITQAKQSLNKINTMFQYEYSEVKACEGIGPLRGNIIDLINRLRQAKDDIDNRNFSETLSPELRNKHFQKKGFKAKSSSYADIWSLFKSLCNKFVSIRKKWKKCLVKHNSFQNSSPTELENSIQTAESSMST